MDFTAMVYFLPEFQGGWRKEILADRDFIKYPLRCPATFDEGETYWTAQLDFIMLPDQYGFGVADVSLLAPEGPNSEFNPGFTFTLHEGPKMIAYCRIV